MEVEIKDWHNPSLNKLVIFDSYYSGQFLYIGEQRGVSKLQVEITPELIATLHALTSYCEASLKLRQQREQP